MKFLWKGFECDHNFPYLIIENKFNFCSEFVKCSPQQISFLLCWTFCVYFFNGECIPHLTICHGASFGNHCCSSKILSFFFSLYFPPFLYLHLLFQPETVREQHKKIKISLSNFNKVVYNVVINLNIVIEIIFMSRERFLFYCIVGIILLKATGLAFVCFELFISLFLYFLTILLFISIIKSLTMHSYCKIISNVFLL